MELSVSSETTFFIMKLQLEICPQLRTGSSAEDTGRIDTITYWGRSSCSNSGWLSCSDTSKINNTTVCLFFYNLRTILGQYTSPPPSIMAADPRCIVGSMVEAKACHVTSLAECARRYGSNSKTKKV